METKHTPGPWIWAKGYKGPFGAGPDNEVLNYFSYEGMHLWGEHEKANARLIAAAPDLLAELQNIANANPSSWDEETRDQFQQWAQNRARAAIAKATGEA
jgi:hypothetical protein